MSKNGVVALKIELSIIKNENYYRVVRLFAVI